MSARLRPSLQQTYLPSHFPSPLLSPIAHTALLPRVRRDPVTKWALEMEDLSRVEYVIRFLGVAQLAESVHVINLSKVSRSLWHELPVSQNPARAAGPFRWIVSPLAQQPAKTASMLAEAFDSSS